MDHALVKRNLSAYLDGAVTPEERALIEEHLEGCPECRGELRELAQTVSRLRSMGEVEPPPWLAVKVMARVREEAGRKRGLLRRLFVPLGWKLPVEAAALVFLTVTGYLVYRAVSPEVAPLPTIVGESPKASAPAAPAETPRRKPAGKAAPAMKIPERGVEPTHAAPGSGPAKGQPGSGGSHLPSGEEAVHIPAAPPMEPKFGITERKEEASGAYHGGAAQSTARDMAVPAEKAAPSPSLRAKSSPSESPEKVRLQLIVDDGDTAVRDIGNAARRFGGKVVRRESGEVGEGPVMVHIERRRLGEFMERLSRIGEIRDRAQLPNGDETVVDVVIEVYDGRP